MSKTIFKQVEFSKKQQQTNIISNVSNPNNLFRMSNFQQFDFTSFKFPNIDISKFRNANFSKFQLFGPNLLLGRTSFSANLLFGAYCIRFLAQRFVLGGWRSANFIIAFTGNPSPLKPEAQSDSLLYKTVAANCKPQEHL